MASKKSTPVGEPAVPAPPEVAPDPAPMPPPNPPERPEDNVFVRALQAENEQLKSDMAKLVDPGEPLKTREWTLVAMRSERHQSDLEFEMFVDDSCEPVQVQVRRAQHGPRVRACGS